MMAALAGLTAPLVFLFRFGLANLVLLLVLSGPSNAQELRLITSPWPPSNFLDETGQPTGLSVEIIQALKTKLGLSTPIEVLPWARGYKLAQSEPDVLLFTAAKTPERVEHGFEFIGPAVMWTHGLLAKQDRDLKVESLDDARQRALTAVGVRGSWQVKLLKKAGIQTVETADHGTSARMLLAGRVDLWITSHLQASTVLKEIGMPASAAKPVFNIRKSPSYLMISKGTDPQLLEKWRRAYEELKQAGILQDVAKEWSTRLGVPLTYRPEEGFSAGAAHKDGTG